MRTTDGKEEEGQTRWKKKSVRTTVTNDIQQTEDEVDTDTSTTISGYLVDATKCKRRGINNN